MKLLQYVSYLTPNFMHANYKLKKLKSSSLNCFSFHNSFCEDIIKVLTPALQYVTTKVSNYKSCLSEPSLLIILT